MDEKYLGNPFKEWKVYDRLLIGQPKSLHLAGGYEQLRYYLFNGSPGPSNDRGVRVALEKLPARAGAVSCRARRPGSRPR